MWSHAHSEPITLGRAMGNYDWLGFVIRPENGRYCTLNSSYINVVCGRVGSLIGIKLSLEAYGEPMDVHYSFSLHCTRFSVLLTTFTPASLLVWASEICKVILTSPIFFFPSKVILVVQSCPLSLSIWWVPTPNSFSTPGQRAAMW